MNSQMLQALLTARRRGIASLRNHPPGGAGTLNDPGTASALGPTIPEQIGTTLNPMLERVQDIFPKDNPYGSFIERLIVGDSPERTRRMAQGIPYQYTGRGPWYGSEPIIRPQVMDLAAALPIGSAATLAKAAVPVVKAAAVPAAMVTSAAALNRLKAPGYAATSTDDIGAALLGRSLQTTGDLNKAMVGGDAGAAALARIGNTAPQQAMELAEQMESAGRSRDEILAATADFGYPVFRGKDGRLRFEIDDSAVKFKEPPVGKSRSDLAGDYFESKGVPRTKRATGQYPELDREALAWADANRQSNPTVPVYESIIHPEMQQAYPDSGVRIGRVDPGTRDLSGYFDPATKEIRYGGGTILNTNKALARILGTDTSTALHELQHATQEAEGFARGGSPGGPYQSGELDQLIQRKYEQIKKLPGNAGETKAALYDHAKKLVNSDEGRREMYRALAGEAEARQVQARMDMSPAERAYKPFYADFDVPEADQIVRYGDGPSAMVGVDPSPFDFSDKRTIKNEAEKLASKLNEAGFRAEVTHSGSAAGASSYVNVYDPVTGRHITDPARFSNHSKGPFQNQFVYNMHSQADTQEFMDLAMSLRKLGPSELKKLEALGPNAQTLRRRAKNQRRKAKQAAKQQKIAEPLVDEFIGKLLED